MGHESEDPRFRASKETQARWGASQRVVLAFAILAGITLLLLFATGIARVGELVAAIAAGVLLYVWVGTYYWYRRSSRTRPEGAAWAGGSSLRVAAIRNAALTGDLRVTGERRLHFLTRGVGAVMGRLEVRSEGLHWTFGFSARLMGVRGGVRVPWKEIENIEVGDVPGTIRRLGGGLAVHLMNGRRLDGQFLGSRADLVESLAQSPLGKRS